MNSPTRRLGKHVGGPRASLFLLLVAHAIAVTGNAVTTFVTPFYVGSLGGNATQIGLATVVVTVPIIAGATLSGVMIDRMGYRRSSIFTSIFSALTVLVIATLGASNHLPLWGFLVLLAFSGLFDTPGQTARNVLLPTLAVGARTPIERVTGLSSGAERMAMLIGAPLAGVSVGWLGADKVFFFSAVFFTISASLVALIPAELDRRTGACAESGSEESVNYMSDLLAGMRFVLGAPLLRNIYIILLLLNALDAARLQVWLPLYADDYLGGAGSAGLITASLSAGLIAGAALFSAWGHRLSRRALFVVCFVMLGGPLSLGFALSASAVVLCSLSAAAGVFGGMLSPLIQTISLEATPQRVRARAQTFGTSLAWIGTPVGAPLAGVSADRVALPLLFAAIGVVYVLMALCPLVGRSWADMNRRRESIGF